MKGKKLKITFMHTRECHIWKVGLNALKAALHEAKKPEKFEIILVTSQAQAEKLKFTGSPTILVNGKNIDPMRRKLKKTIFSGCTLYTWKGKAHEFPPKEMILAALKGK